MLPAIDASSAELACRYQAASATTLALMASLSEALAPAYRVLCNSDDMGIGDQAAPAQRGPVTRPRSPLRAPCRNFIAADDRGQFSGMRLGCDQS